jgi:bifunctional DNA-binding transcriptional regulator/antitoxin component of YhaV-PrlF toxin-antitoxin module
MKMSTRITPVEAGHKIQLPAEWAAELGLENVAILEKTETGILVRPCSPATWDEIFADKLPMGQQPLALDLSEVSGDDLLL